MKTNYHTHTQRCNHAHGSDEAYVKSAIAAGFTELGFADHTPWPYKSKFYSPMRMQLDELDHYLSSLRMLKEKYKDQISIKIGLECEYFPEYIDWLEQLKASKRVDYLIFGNHFHLTDEHGIYFGREVKDETTLKMYVDEAVKGMETKLYAYLCHPDLFMRSYGQWDALCERESIRLCEAAKACDVPLEYNLQGLIYNRKFKADSYPHPKFWEVVARVGNRVIIGVDAHKNEELESDDYEQAIVYLTSIGCNIIQTFD
ncbi:MAG: histidinol-phosphatase [Erysipelotrichaceae bacterium]